MMRVLIKRVGQEPEVKRIKNDLYTMQDIVGGFIQCVNFPGDIICVMNEEGKLKGLPPNFELNKDLIVGDVFFCSANREYFGSLDDDQIELIMCLLYIFDIKTK